LAFQKLDKNERSVHHPLTSYLLQSISRALSKAIADLGFHPFLTLKDLLPLAFLREVPQGKVSGDRLYLCVHSSSRSGGECRQLTTISAGELWQPSEQSSSSLQFIWRVKVCLSLTAYCL